MAVVYFLRLGRYIKIGWTTQPDQRFRSLDSGPKPLKVVHTIQTPIAGKLECHFHRLFKGLRVRGEWFCLDRATMKMISAIYECPSLHDLPEVWRPAAKRPPKTQTKPTELDIWLPSDSSVPQSFTHFPGRLRMARRAAGMTQLQLAAKAKVTNVCLSRLESGQRTPGLGTALKLTNALGISIDDVLWPAIAGRVSDLLAPAKKGRKP